VRVEMLHGGAKKKIVQHLIMGVTVTVFLWGIYGPFSAGGQQNEGGQALSSDGKDPEEVGRDLLRKLSEKSITDIRRIKLSYDLHMHMEGNVKTRMRVILEMRKKGDGYEGLFHLIEPEGKDTWSKFILFVYGKHTEEYKEMIKAINVIFVERLFRRDGAFVTDEFKEVLPEKKPDENLTGIKVHFDYHEGRVKFWEDQQQEIFSRAMTYRDQMGPMTAFFGYLFFGDPEREVTIINVVRQTEEVLVEGGRWEESDKVERINFLFEAQAVKIRPNETGRQTAYENAVYFERENYLDVIYGKHVFFRLVRDPKSHVKIPYSIHLDGIISKAKKREKEKRVRKIMTNYVMEQEILEEKLRELENFDTLASKDVKVYLAEGEVVFN
jgi:hypothetical protein